MMFPTSGRAARRPSGQPPQRRLLAGLEPLVVCLLPTSLDNGQRSPRKLLRSVVARLVGRGMSRSK